jgi:LysR family transcriptional regulator, glycine cleavage system transcriptional activator
MRHLPSIRSLMAFEAIARHQSVSRAANELSITQAAASIRLKGLEEQLGFPLFLRTNGHFSLTAAGARYLATVHKVIADLSEAAERAIRPSHTVRLCIRTALAQKWLIPRLAGLMQHVRDVDIDLQAVDDESDDMTDGDLFIGHCADTDRSSVKLMDDEFIAVCRPEMVEQVRSFHPKELRAVKWLHEAPSGARSALADPLVDWLGRVGLGVDDIGPRLSFRNPCLLVDATLHGVGVGVARHSLVADHLAARTLARLFHHGVPGAEAIYLTFAPGLQHDPVIAKIRDWLLQQAAAHRQLMVPKEKPPRALRSA